LAFAILPDGELTPVASRIIDSMTGNPVFPAPPVSLDELKNLRDIYSVKLVEAKDGTTEDTLAKDIAKENLNNALRQVAAYVQSLASQDLQSLLSSGFEAASTNRARIELPKPNVLRVENPQSTQIALRLDPVPTAKAYEVRVSYGPDGWHAAGIFTQARRIVLANLTPGTTYTIQVRAIGGITGASEWSDPISHMSL
jgi:hypothetical protein